MATKGLQIAKLFSPQNVALPYLVYSSRWGEDAFERNNLYHSLVVPQEGKNLSCFPHPRGERAAE